MRTHAIAREDFSAPQVITGLAWDIGPVTLRDGRLWIPVEPRRRDVRRVAPRAGLLVRFCTLHAKTDGDILRFAQRYGLLHVCEAHHLPAGHVAGCEATYADNADGELCYVDDLSQWREWSRRFAAVAEIARCVQTGTRPASAEIDVLEELSAPGVYRLRHARRNLRAIGLAFVVNALLNAAGVRRRVEWWESRLRLTDGLHGECPLFGAVTMELAGVAVGVISQARCEACGEAFPADDHRQRYCRKHRRADVRWQTAKQRQRAALYARGLTARGTRRRRT